MESEKYVVWITLQACQFKWKRVIVQKVKRDGIDLMSIFYTNTNHREKCFRLYTVQEKGETTTYVPIVFMLSSILGSIFCGEVNTTWELHRIVKAWVKPKYREVKQTVHHIH